MKLWNSFLNAQAEINTTDSSNILTIGNFDGVHRGHQTIISRVIELAQLSGDKSLAITFANHTESYLGARPLLLSQPLIRRELLARQGLDAILEMEFTRDFATLEPEDFFNNWLVDGLKTKSLVVGYDFRFGANGSGDFRLLQKLGAERKITVEQVPPVDEAGEIISSSKIRQLLAQGQIGLANKMLGYPFQIQGEVITGEQRGRSLGYPTANIHLEPEYQLPGYGVYLVRFLVEGQSYFGVASVGVKPTFGLYTPMIEVFLFDVTLNLYGKIANVEFLYFIRPELRFSDIITLKTQITNDVKTAKEILPSFQQID